MKLFSRLKFPLILFGLILVGYGGVRLYYAITGGFTIGNITSDLSYDSRWKTHILSATEKILIDQALDQEYHYLGKGCQAYVFASNDGKYVLKFFKYQRFRKQPWIDAFTFIPAINRYQEDKSVSKKNKLDNVFRSWKIAFENLSPETGVFYVHLNKSDDLRKILTVRDKLGLTRQLDLDQMEFLLQHRAEMLCPTIKTMIEQGNEIQGKKLIDRLLTMLLSEYARGFADNDHALMQNTGVWEEAPVHIDVGQFIYNDIVKDPSVYRQELYDKTYKFLLWLKKHDQSLAQHLENRLVAIIGEEYFLKAPYVHKSDVSKIPHKSPDIELEEFTTEAQR